MEPITFAVIAIFILAYGLISKRLERTVISAPIVFVLFGIVLCDKVTGLISGGDHKFIEIIANLTLILVLFIDASRIDLKLLRKEGDLPLVMLAIGLPLTIIFGIVAALILFTGLPLWEAAILATILAPTDAALAQVVINSEKVPVCIRQALNVESGLNDGICLPILLLFISLAVSAEGFQTTSYWVGFTARQLILGPVVGIIVGYIGAKTITIAVEKNWMSESFEKLSGLALPLIAFYLAEPVHGNGFISAFFAGLVFGNFAKKVARPIHEFGEAEGSLLILLTFILFGATMVPEAIGQINAKIILYSILSLTIVRMLPVAISVAGKGILTSTKVFMGWFGPRGAASILYLLIILKEDMLTNGQLIFNVSVVTILFSIFLHGLTSVPGVKAYASSLGVKPVDIPEKIKKVSEMPTRRV
ncbi:MAG: cation:proton antiporter [Thermodesulfobacteriota bacterium]